MGEIEDRLSPTLSRGEGDEEIVMLLSFSSGEGDPAIDGSDEAICIALLKL